MVATRGLPPRMLGPGRHQDRKGPRDRTTRQGGIERIAMILAEVRGLFSYISCTEIWSWSNLEQTST